MHNCTCTRAAALAAAALAAARAGGGGGEALCGRLYGPRLGARWCLAVHRQSCVVQGNCCWARLQ